MQPTITPPKTFKLKTHLVFTTIEIKTIVKNKKYVGEFQSGDKYKIDCSIAGNSIPEVIEKVSKFLDCQIDERHYIIK